MGLLIASLVILATTAPGAVATEDEEPTKADLVEAMEKIEDRLLVGIAETDGETQATILDVLAGIQSFSLDDCETLYECIEEFFTSPWPIIPLLIDLVCIALEIAQIIVDYGLAVVDQAQAFVDAVITEACMIYNGDPDCLPLDEAVAPMDPDTGFGLCAETTT